MASNQYDLIIVGAGIAGIACARRLHEAEQPFRLISENLGGRIRRSRDGGTATGAIPPTAHHLSAAFSRRFQCIRWSQRNSQWQTGITSCRRHAARKKTTTRDKAAITRFGCSSIALLTRTVIGSASPCVVEKLRAARTELPHPPVNSQDIARAQRHTRP